MFGICSGCLTFDDHQLELTPSAGHSFYIFIINQTSVSENMTNERICLCEIYYNSNTVAMLSKIEEEMIPRSLALHVF